MVSKRVTCTTSEAKRPNAPVTDSQVRPVPFLKWAGGKQQLIQQFEPMFPKKISRYIEPFLGSGAVFFHLVATRPPFSAVLMDNNKELIQTYEAVKHYVERLTDSLLQLKKQHSPEHYYHVRSEQPTERTKVAARFIYLNKTCFNGLYRVNAKGRFNVPIGSYNNPAIFDPANLHAVSASLQNVELRVAHFAECLLLAKRDEFIYFDPPYQPLSATANFTGYTKQSFGEKEQRQLADVYRELDKRGCILMLSNSDTPLVRTLYAGFRVETVFARRAINSKADKRGAITELVVLNY